MIYEHFKISDISDLVDIDLRRDNVQTFDTKWDETIIPMQKLLDDTHILPPHRRRSRDQTTRPLEQTTLDNTTTQARVVALIQSHPETGSLGWVPTGHPRCTWAHYDGEAVGGSPTHPTRAHMDAHRNMVAEQRNDPRQHQPLQLHRASFQNNRTCGRRPKNRSGHCCVRRITTPATATTPGTT